MLQIGSMFDQNCAFNECNGVISEHCVAFVLILTQSESIHSEAQTGERHVSASDVPSCAMEVFFLPVCRIFLYLI